MNVYRYYNTSGWKKDKSNFEDAKLFEDLRINSKDYVSKCRKRILKFIPKEGKNILDFASGPIQYKEYLLYSKNFKYRHCVDFSKEAIKIAKKKLKKKGKYYCNDFLKIKFKKNFFDCIISMHTIYHIDQSKQAQVINKMIDVAKPNTPIIIVYSNPDNIISKIKKVFKYKRKNKIKNNLYFFCNSNKWWNKFKKRADINMYPWRSFSSGHQKILFPDNFLGKYMLKILYLLEDKFKNFFVKNFQYQIIILKKKTI